MSAKQLLLQGIAALALNEAINKSIEQRLLQYLELLEKWNRVYNLTAIREKEEMVTHHLLDCLAIVPHLKYLEEGYILDVGSGAGLPGIVLALVNPRWQITLLDSSHKKTSFVKQVSIELELQNIEVITERVEQWQAPRLYDLIISRAFSDLAEFVDLTAHLCAANGKFAAMKGLYPYEELAQLPPQVRQEQIISFEVPKLNAKRHLVMLKQVTP